MIAERVVDQRHAERLEGFRDGISQLRAVAHLFFDLELPGALDEMTRVIHVLDKQRAAFALEMEPVFPAQRPGRKGRRLGIDLRPGSVKFARIEAGLSLAKVAGKELTPPAIHYIETGKSRPSLPTLQLIAARTGKPLEFFVAKTPWNAYAATTGLDLSAEISA